MQIGKKATVSLMAPGGSNVVTGPNRNTGNTLNELFSKNYMSIMIKIIIIYEKLYI